MSEHDQTRPPSSDDQNSHQPLNETVESGEPVNEHDDETRSRTESVNTIGQQIGPYRILEELGEGGMGTVYLAEQRCASRPVRDGPFFVSRPAIYMASK